MPKGPKSAPRKPAAVPWPVAAGIAAVLVAIIVALLFAAMRHGRDASRGEAATTAATSTRSGPTRAGGPIEGVDGCLGGADPSTAIYTALKAPQTRAGAVSFVATVVRWEALLPKPAGQLDEIGPKIMTPEVLKIVKDSQRPDVKRWADMTSAVYKVTSSSPGRVTVAMSFDGIGTQSGQRGTATTSAYFEVTARHGQWVVSSITSGPGNADQVEERVRRGATALPGGCS